MNDSETARGQPREAIITLEFVIDLDVLAVAAGETPGDVVAFMAQYLQSRFPGIKRWHIDVMRGADERS